MTLKCGETNPRFTAIEGIFLFQSAAKLAFFKNQSLCPEQRRETHVNENKQARSVHLLLGLN